MNNKDEAKTVKLRIQLQPYNGLKYDFIEVMTPIGDIPKHYNALKTLFKDEIKQKSYVPGTFTKVPQQDWNKPSPSQLRFAAKLGVINPASMNKQEVSEAITLKLVQLREKIGKT